MILRKCLLCVGLSYCAQPDLEEAPLQIEHDTQPTVEQADLAQLDAPLYEKPDQIEKLIQKMDNPPNLALDTLEYLIYTVLAGSFIVTIGVMATNIGVMATNIGVMATNIGVMATNIGVMATKCCGY